MSTDQQNGLVWDPASGTILARWKAIKKQIVSVALDPAGTLLAIGTAKGGVDLFAVPDGRKLWALDGLGKHARPLAFLPHSQDLLSGDEKGQLYLHDASSGALRWAIRAHAMPIEEAYVLADGRELVTVGAQQTSRSAKRWRLDDQAFLGTVALSGRVLAEQDWSHALLLPQPAGSEPRVLADGRQTSEAGQPPFSAGLATTTGHGRWLQLSASAPLLRSLHEPVASAPLGQAQSWLASLSVNGQRALIVTDNGWALDLWELPPPGSSVTGPARRLQRLGMDTRVWSLVASAAGGWAAATEGGVVLFFPG